MYKRLSATAQVIALAELSSELSADEDQLRAGVHHLGPLDRVVVLAWRADGRLSGAVVLAESRIYYRELCRERGGRHGSLGQAP
jgi:hypothetical protein